MGGGSWSSDFYRDREVVRKNTGESAFAYHEEVKRTGVRKVHAKMNPSGIIRESRDSKEHPDSNAVAVVFDVTGSMQSIPIVLQKKLPSLMGILYERKYLPHPQVLFGAVGDFTCDKGSLQIGQFESDIRADDDMGRMWLEGGGGGSMEESYQLALYFFARHTSIDCFEKRKKKGYLFLMGDEMPYSKVTKREAKEICGDTLQEDISIEDIIKEVQAKYNLFFILPGGASNSGNALVRERWVKLLGQNVIQLDDPSGVCEAITMTIGLCEGTANLDSVKDDLKTAGSNAKDINTAAAALKDVAKAKGSTSKVARL
jgi:hypothetical protein